MKAGDYTNKTHTCTNAHTHIRTYTHTHVFLSEVVRVVDKMH